MNHLNAFQHELLPTISLCPKGKFLQELHGALRRALSIGGLAFFSWCLPKGPLFVIRVKGNMRSLGLSDNAAISFNFTFKVSVSFQSIANSEPWWSHHVRQSFYNFKNRASDYRPLKQVLNGQRLGVVARHMSRRVRVQSRQAPSASASATTWPQPAVARDPRAEGALRAGNAHDVLGSTELGGAAGQARQPSQEEGQYVQHGFQGRWFCLVHAPADVVGVASTKLRVAKAVPGAFSLVQVCSQYQFFN